MRGTPAERFWAKVEKTDTCWLWTAAHTKENYGKFWYQGRLELAHRVSWTWTNGPIPDGYTLDHVWDNGCRHTNCVRPEHLEILTTGDNTRRWALRITHCPKNHEYTPENTYTYNNMRSCKTCNRDRARERYRRLAGIQ